MNVEKAWDTLKEHSFKRTKNREAILDFLAERDGYIAAMDVGEFLKKKILELASIPFTETCPHLQPSVFWKRLI